MRIRGPWRQALGRFRRHPLGIAALVGLVVFVVVGALAGTISPYYPGQEFIQFLDKPQHPFVTPHHLLGTDVLSRDFSTQLLFAIRETTVSALVCAGGATAVGVVVGALAGYYGGVFESLLTWVTNVVVAVPAIAVLIIVSVWARFPETPMGFGLWLMALLWTSVARVVQASVLVLRRREFVEAAYAAGASDLRIVVRHLLPNALGAIIVAATSVVGQAIVIVATVDYLGYGYNQPEHPTLGGLVADATASEHLILGGQATLGTVWWLYAFPAILLVLLLLCVTFLGDALNDALNPVTA
ncbi:MAG TPA: ABC transporter permease [Gaiellaceae bacterium]|nr:ABC transporter permease [Gaiellaceae bacterium]